MLYICATPIGNLLDITYRAIEILSNADIILCEDTRNSSHLLKHYSINQAKLISLHQHNENHITEKVLEYLANNKIIVQISDAGTPSISDPGARLCNQVINAGYQISPLPGACAYTTLLSVSGIDSAHLFYGFLPHTSNKRINILNDWQNINYAVILYEAPHRILETLYDIQTVFGHEKIIVLGRELTKQFETIKKMPIEKLIQFISNDPYQQKGEFVIIICADKKTNTLTQKQQNAINEISKFFSPKKAASFVAKYLDGDKNQLYNYLLNQKNETK
jgi:16S rRNA (cytidine1402-2'-O)-methyltransferase